MSGPRTSERVEAVERFRTEARAFCELVERSGELSRFDLLAALSAHLVDVYAAAIRLPPGDPEADETLTVEEPVTDDWRELASALHEKLGELDAYWLVFDPATAERPVAASISDDVADVYLDLKAVERERGAISDDALWEWIFAFQSHWGRHAVSALAAIHPLVHAGRVE